MCKPIDEDQTHTRNLTAWVMLNLKNQKHTESTDKNTKKVKPCSTKDHPQRYANPIEKILQETSLSSSLHNSPMFSTSNKEKEIKEPPCHHKQK